ncbi:transposase [Kordia algicida OT-1]|uniref:Transposase n=2 Tax=Kordia TaxID=221065 RepID=A9CUF7_9FLAO|nr:transposase [Kordia algicida OT-1]
MLGNTTIISLKARKFHCLTSNCPRKIFTERFSKHFLPYRRTTTRLEKSILSIALETGGNITERISKSIGIPVRDTICIRRIYKSPLPDIKAPEILGVDDWAYKKGHRYCTVLVNLQNNNIIDLLLDREASSLENWLKNHTGVKIISRGRYGKYIQGATKGAPQAIQVTDRWHLLKNLKQVAIKIMNREYAKLSQLTTTESQKIKKISVSKNEARLLNKSQKRFIEMKKLQQEGLSIQVIARELNMHRQTVKKYILLEYLPQKCYKRESNIETHFSYIEKRVKEEPKILLKTLWEELKVRGYRFV